MVEYSLLESRSVWVFSVKTSFTCAVLPCRTLVTWKLEEITKMQAENRG